MLRLSFAYQDNLYAEEKMIGAPNGNEAVVRSLGPIRKQIVTRKSIVQSTAYIRDAETKRLWEFGVDFFENRRYENVLALVTYR